MTTDNLATKSAAVPSFETLPFAPFLQETIRTVGYTTPTPIQADAIPLILEGRDLIGLAQTGTGKTAAFVLPLLQRLSGGKKKGVQALILAPTRELAEQINDVIKTFSGRTGVRSVTVYGGVSHRNQISQLRTNVQIVVACPGRLMDHIRGNTIDLSGTDYLILDEADRMLDMGFMPDIKAIISELPEGRQTMLFSATMPDEIAELTKTYLKDPTTVRVKAEQPVALVSHSMFTLKQEEKSERLASWLRANPEALTVVFTKMKHTAKRLGDRLTKDGVPATSLHGNLSQAQRQKALQGFRDGRFRALIATDIASRGIDVEGVTHVLNYDMPETLEAYIHRTGRAGRASREGSAVSFVTRGDRFMVRAIEQWLKSSMIRLNAESEESSDAELSTEAGARQPRSARSGRSTRSGDRQGNRRERFDRRERPSRDRRQADGRGERQERRSDAAPRRDGDGARPNRRESFGTDGRSPRQWRPRRDEQGNQRGFGDRDVSDRPRRDNRGSFDGERPRGPRRSGPPSRGNGPREEGYRPAGRSGGRSGERSVRGSSDRPFSKPRGGNRPAGRSRPSSDRGGSFKGQADIDPKADYVYREREPFFIDRGDSKGGQRRGRPGAGRNRRGPGGGVRGRRE
ncbi:MAG: DEAD/DEAH box helicase [Pseudomonadota bacterium]|jgi:ATP-dependent RNA helicase RhlE